MTPEKLQQIDDIFSHFAYHNKNLTKKQWFMIEDLRLLVDELKQEAQLNDSLRRV